MNIIIENAITNFEFYQNNIPLNYQKMIEKHPSDYIALGARSEESFIGIIMAKKNLKISIIEIVYLAVSDWNKTTGVEEMLIYALEDKAQKEKVNFINFDYFDNNDLDYLKYIDGILRKNNWSSLRTKNYIYITRSFKVEEHYWFRRFIKNTKNLSIFQWGLLSEDDRQKLKEEEGNGYPKKLSPFINEDQIDKKSSIGVKADGKVVGWFLIQEVSPTMVFIKSVYLKEGYRSIANIKQLMSTGIMQTIYKSKSKYVMFSIGESNKQMLNFVERKFKNAIISKKPVYRSLKRINQNH